jgi:hypothetical protein
MTVDVPEHDDLTGVEIWLDPARAIRVRVERDDGTPVREATVASTDESGRSANSTTDASGTTEIHGIGAVTVRVSIWRDPTLLPVEDQVVPAESSAVTVVVPSGEVISGRVLDPEARGVAGALVALVDGSPAPRNCTCDPAGAFSLTVPRGAVGRLVFGGDVLDADGMGFRWRPLTASLDVRSERTDLVLRAVPVRTGLSLRVRVTGADGRPCSGQTVMGLRNGTFGGLVVRTDADGVAVFADLDERPLRLRVPASSRGTLTPGVDVVPADQEVILALEPSARIVGKVQRGAGAPGGEVRVALGRSGTIVATTLVPAESDSFEFWVPDETGAQYAVEATLFSADGGDQAARGVAEDVAPGTDDLRIVLTTE